MLLTVVEKPIIRQDACTQIDDVEEEVTVVVDTNAVKDPWAVAIHHFVSVIETGCSSHSVGLTH
jgi:hypothetical protein